MEENFSLPLSLSRKRIDDAFVSISLFFLDK